MITRNQVIAFSAGGVVGGVIGYLIGDWLAYKYTEYENPFSDSDLSELNKAMKDNTDYVSKDYSSIYSPEDKPELEDLAGEYQTESAGPFIITEDEWTSLHGHEKVTIMYYPDDNTFCDASEEVIDDPNELFGTNIHLHFGDESNDPDVVYVLNAAYSNAYEIIKTEGSYKTQVLQDPPDPPKKKRGRPKGSKNKPKEEPGAE